MIRRFPLLLLGLAASLASAAPVPDGQGPREVARAFFEAIYSGSPDRAVELCTGQEMRDEIEGLSAYVGAGLRVETALAERFGAAAAAALGVGAEVRRALDAVAEAPVRIDGDSSSLAVKEDTGLTADTLALRRVEGRWRVVAGPLPPPTLAEHHRKRARSYPAAADEVLKDLAAGRYATPKAAVDGYHARQSTLMEAAEPAALLGRWVAQDKQAKILELRADGTGSIEGLPLTWSVQGTKLTVSDPTGTDTTEWRVVGNRLVLTAAFGAEIVFVRTDDPPGTGSPLRP